MAIEKLQTYRCELCGNIIEVLHVGGGTLVCCEQEMTLLVENTVEAAVEKHVPVLEKTTDGFKVIVGSVAHPMEDNHYIEWIELIADGKSYTAFLSPGNPAEATFALEAAAVTARAYCNLHGLWKS